VLVAWVGGLQISVYFACVEGDVRTFLYELEVTEQIDSEFFLDPFLCGIQNSGILSVSNSRIVDENGWRRTVQDGSAGGLNFRLRGQVAFVVGQIGN
jgi:hypothetical protein